MIKVKACGQQRQCHNGCNNTFEERNEAKNKQNVILTRQITLINY
jgi:hypothetical protein